MANIQYAESGTYTLAYNAEDECSNKRVSNRTVKVNDKTYTITFDSKGGSAVSTMSVGTGETATNFPTPEKSGKAFKGWYDNPYCYGDPITEIKDVQGNHTLYAKWGEETYGTYIFGDNEPYVLGINVPESKKAQYISQYGAIKESYDPLGDDASYVFINPSDSPWWSYRVRIGTVDIGSDIHPTKMDYWFWMFAGMQNFIGAEKIHLDRCTSLKSTFEGMEAPTLDLDLSSWDTSGITNFDLTFGATIFKSLNVANWNTNAGTTFASTVSTLKITGSNKAMDFSAWDLSNATNVSSMFAATEFDTLILGNPDTSKVTNFSNMFAASKLRTIISDDFDYSSISPSSYNSNSLFDSARNLVGGNGTAWNQLYIMLARAVVDMPGRQGYFTAPTSVKVHFEPNDGITPYDAVYNTRTLINLPTPTSPTGKGFIGWHLEQDLSDTAITNITLYHSLTLYGEWKSEGKLIYNLDNGESPIEVPANDGETVQLDVRPEKTGYNFAGWYDNVALTGSAIGQITINGETNVYAKWVDTISDTHILFRDTNNKYTLVLSIPDEQGVIDVAKTIYGRNVVKKYTNTVSGSDLWYNDATNRPLINRVVPWSSLCSISVPKNAFRNCYALTDASLIGFREWKGNPAYVEDMSGFFQNCRELIRVQWDNTLHIQGIANCDNFYMNCAKLEGELQAPPIASISSAQSMFSNCESITKVVFLDPTSFATCESTRLMFNALMRCTEIHLPSTLNTEKLKDTHSMFYGCTQLTTIDNLDRLKLDENASAYNIVQTFMNCRSISVISLPNWTFDVSKITDFQGLFRNCERLQSVFVPASFDLSTTASSIPATNWSENCYQLEGRGGLHWDSTMASDRSYAKTGQFGLFKEYF